MAETYKKVGWQDFPSQQTPLNAENLGQMDNGIKENRDLLIEAMERLDSIPSKLSELESDSTHRTVTDEEKQAWNNKSDFSGAFGDLTGKPTSLSGYGITDGATKEQVGKIEGQIADQQEALDGKQPKGDYAYKNEIPNVPVQSVNGETGDVLLSASDVGAEASGTAQAKVSEHNISQTSHNDIRLLIEGLSTRLNALADSDDATLDQMSEIVAYIKSNKSLIDGITTGKVSVSDIIDNLTTNVSNKPLSAKQGVALKALIDAIVVPTKLSELTGDAAHRTVTDAEKSTWNAKSNFSGSYNDLTGKPSAETWTFTLADGSTVTKKVVLS